MPAASSRLRRWLPLLIVWIIAAAYTGARLNRGWIPMDEGALGHAAERVMQGKLPVARLIAERIGLEDVNRAFDQMRAGDGARRVLIH